MVLDYILRRAHCFIENDDDEAAAAAEAEDEENAMPKYEEHENDPTAPEMKSWGEKNRNLNIGITKLISDGVFIAAYPLHEPTEKKEVASETNNRIMLRRYWASYPSFARQQPLDYIR
ncbi:unnamed protein product [Echinostoma caproni]|uniref:Anoctamin dimerisation domain-containing protein n=1 Tax=Echinostoma caproni TaxID=27848 RepID=A0A3P8L4M2_9TREM|nr:unnamed protein product [Echinostoma caproni]